MRETVNYSVRMPVALRQKLEELAEAQDRKPADVVRRMIRLAYADLKRQQQDRRSAEEVGR